MLFGYIKDYTVKYVYCDEITNKVVISFNSYEHWLKWVSQYSKIEFIDLVKGLKKEIIKVPWYENNFEIVKLILPFFILYEFIGFYASLLFGLVFWVYYFYYQKRFKDKK